LNRSSSEIKKRIEQEFIRDFKKKRFEQKSSEKQIMYNYPTKIIFEPIFVISASMTENKLRVLPPDPFLGKRETLQDWLFLAKNYITGNEINLNNCVKFLLPLLKGDALKWAQSLSPCPKSWSEFESAITKYYPPLPDHLLQRTMTAIKQENYPTMQAYIDAFAAAALPIKELPDSQKKVPLH